ncbi:MAG: DinB family protein [Chloroflexi bacterium]|nr:DinB family protein [Chloroflexota bacterium]
MADETAIRELVEKMAEERDKLLGQIEALSEGDAERTPAGAQGEAQWSAKEQCAHLAEMETAYRAWVERALENENPNVDGVRGERVAIPLEEANRRPLADLVTELRRQREKTSALIERLAPEQYDRTATQPVFGTLTVLQWLRSYYRHDRMHQAQIAGRASDYQPRFAGGREPDQRRARLP